uniref:Uncharacterized protein n=1 Tax=Calcidiscus leptoporus TaxID=127549 RepID=A0A7S0J4Q9_9EUKA
MLMRWLQPVAAATAIAEEEAVEQRRRQLPKTLALSAPPPMAEQRARAFEEAAQSWRLGREEVAWRDAAARSGRIAVSSLVFSISGGSIAAPFLAGLGVCASLQGSPSSTHLCKQEPRA